MIKFDKWFLPDGEEHLQGWMNTVQKKVDGRLTYQYGKYARALEFVKNRRVAIDVGAHVGLWSYFMAGDFEDLAAFEPVAEHRECWYANMKDRLNAELFDVALGEENKTGVRVACRTENSTGDSGIEKGRGNVNMCTLDHFNFENVDFIKIDTEGYELNILKGAIKTLQRCKPCVIVEQKGTMALKYDSPVLGAVHFLESQGAKNRDVISGDYILSWD